MNAWLAAAIALLLGTVPLLAVLLTADTMSRLVALEVASVDMALVFLLLAQYFGRSFYADAAVVLSVLSFGGGLTFARLLERWLPA